MDEELRRMLDREQIRELMTRYNIAVGAKDIDTLVGLFDPEVDHPKYGKGREAVRAYYEPILNRPGEGLHASSNHQIDFVTDDLAYGAMFIRTYHGHDGRWSEAMSLALDTYVRRDGRWYLSLREPADLRRYSFEGETNNPNYRDLSDGWQAYRDRMAGLRDR